MTGALSNWQRHATKAKHGRRSHRSQSKCISAYVVVSRLRGELKRQGTVASAACLLTHDAVQRRLLLCAIPLLAPWLLCKPVFCPHAVPAYVPTSWRPLAGVANFQRAPVPSRIQLLLFLQCIGQDASLYLHRRVASNKCRRLSSASHRYHFPDIESRVRRKKANVSPEAIMHVHQGAATSSPTNHSLLLEPAQHLRPNLLPGGHDLVWEWAREMRWRVCVCVWPGG